MEHTVEKKLVITMKLDEKEAKTLATCLYFSKFDSLADEARKEELITFASRFHKILIEATD